MVLPSNKVKTELFDITGVVPSVLVRPSPVIANSFILFLLNSSLYPNLLFLEWLANLTAI